MLDETLLRILVCPADHGPLLLIERADGAVLYNPRLHRAYRIEDDIPVLLIDEATQVSNDEHTELMARVGPTGSQ